MSAGIHTLGIVIDANRVLLSYDEIVNLVGYSPSLLFEYNALVNAVKNDISVAAEPGVITLHGTPLKKTPNAKIREILLSKKMVIADTLVSWSLKFGTDITSKPVWSLPFQIMKDARAREIQWKIIHNIYPSKVTLKRMKISDTDLCDHCQVSDTVEHFFYQCHKVKPLWNEIQRKANTLYGAKVNLTEQNVILGYSLDKPMAFVKLNQWIIIAKLCVSKFKYGNHPNLLFLFDCECSIRKME